MNILMRLMIVLLLFSLNNASAENIRAFFAYNTFYTPESGPYIETYLKLDGSSLIFQQTEEGRYQATVNVLMLFKQGEEIKDFRKYELRSPVIENPDENDFSFIDQQRFLIPNGDYTLEITLDDMNDDIEPVSHVEEFSIQYDQAAVTVSSVQLAERIEPATETGPLTKSGLNIYPKVYSFFSSDDNNLISYTEIYNASAELGENEAFLVVSSIQEFETRKVVKDFNRFKRENAREVNVFTSNFDISGLPTGNYLLVISAVNRNNETLASNMTFFRRTNQNLLPTADDIDDISIRNTFAEEITNPDSLSYFLKALGPISTHNERLLVNNLIASGNMEHMQQYFYHFWLQRDPAQPETAWMHYYIQMCRADAYFKTVIKRGYDTERGRVYLQYGPPNSINPNYEEPTAYPYEIWHYHAINGQRDKRFVFYSRDLATNEFELIHSDVIGELSNTRWHLMLHNRRFDTWNVDTQWAPDHWGAQSRDFFIEPK